MLEEKDKNITEEPDDKDLVEIALEEADGYYDDLIEDLAVDDPVRAYFKEVSRYDLLTEEETYALSIRAKNGDKKAFDRLIECNLRLPIYVAKHYVNANMEFLVLIQEGNLGLVRGARGFDPNRGFRFSTYVTWWIRQKITRAIQNDSRAIRIPVHAGEIIDKYKRIKARLENEQQRKVTFEEVAAYINVPVKTLREYINMDTPPMSLDAYVNDEDATLYDFVLDTNDCFASAYEEKYQQALSKEIRRAIDESLTEQEAFVIRHYYGIDATNMTLKEIGETGQIGKVRKKGEVVSKQYVKQIETKALKALKKCKRLEVFQQPSY